MLRLPLLFSVGRLAVIVIVAASYVAALPPEWNLPQPGAAAWGSAVPGSHRCWPIPSTMGLCYGIGYPEMRLPNMLNHESAKEVEEQTKHWQALVNTNCHPEIRVLLCSIYAPVCIEHLLEKSIQPCRSLCESVKSSCLAIHGEKLMWLYDQACVQEPSYEYLVSGYCMNDIVLKARIDHVTTGAAGRQFQIQRPRLRFFLEPPRPRRKRQRQRQRRRNVGGRRRKKREPVAFRFRLPRRWPKSPTATLAADCRCCLKRPPAPIPKGLPADGSRLAAGGDAAGPIFHFGCSAQSAGQETEAPDRHAAASHLHAAARSLLGLKNRRATPARRRQARQESAQRWRGAAGGEPQRRTTQLS
uniref:FZ domain-containing protein n=1 Tax=Macrostomum lignano TaxID=282301 RepID=A0A1I8FC12_9PLAT